MSCERGAARASGSASVPHLHRPVVRRGRHEFLPAPTRHRSIKRVDDLAVGADFAHALAGGDVRVGERVVGGDSVNEGRAEGPLEVKNGCFGVAGEEGVVGVRWVGSPQSYKQG